MSELELALAAVGTEGAVGGPDLFSAPRASHEAFLRCALLHERHSTWRCSWSSVRSRVVPQIEHHGCALLAALDVARHVPAYWVRRALRARFHSASQRGQRVRRVRAEQSRHGRSAFTMRVLMPGPRAGATASWGNGCRAFRSLCAYRPSSPRCGLRAADSAAGGGALP